MPAMTQLDACGWVDLNLPRAGGAEDREEIYQERVAATSSLGEFTCEAGSALSHHSNLLSQVTGISRPHTL